MAIEYIACTKTSEAYVSDAIAHVKAIAADKLSFTVNSRIAATVEWRPAAKKRKADVAVRIMDTM